MVPEDELFMFGTNEQLNPEYEHIPSNRSGASKVQINAYKDKQAAFQKPLFHIQDDIQQETGQNLETSFFHHHNMFLYKVQSKK
jgi:hypothetical protein